jgi:hypothetical protein
VVHRGQGRQLGRGHAHPEQGHREEIEDLGVADRGDGAEREQGGREQVHIAADLHAATPGERLDEAATDGPHPRDAGVERHAQTAREPEGGRQQDEQLAQGSDQRTPRHRPRQGRLLQAHQRDRDQRRDDPRVPHDRGDVGEEEAPMTVEDRQAPRGHDQEPHAGRDDPDQGHGQLETLGSRHETPGEHAGDRSGEHDGQRHDHRYDGDKDPHHCTGQASRVVRAAGCHHSTVDRDERSRQHALAEQVLEQVRHPQRSPERLRADTGAEESRGHDLAHETGEAREQDAGSHRRGAAPQVVVRRVVSCGHGRLGRGHSITSLVAGRRAIA